MEDRSSSWVGYGLEEEGDRDTYGYEEKASNMTSFQISEFSGKFLGGNF